MLKNWIKRISDKIFGYKGLVSYSQSGEDLILNFLVRSRKLANVSYLDIGSGHPKTLSNTYFFYKHGYQGVTVDANPENVAMHRSLRPNDISLNLGVGADCNESVEFYIASSRALSTFSKTEAERYEKETNQKIERVIKVPIKKADDLIDKYFKGHAPCIVSIDVEGWEIEVLKSLDFQKYQPEIFCIETLIYSEDKTCKKNLDITKFMLDKGYQVYADTMINTIYTKFK